MNVYICPLARDGVCPDLDNKEAYYEDFCPHHRPHLKLRDCNEPNDVCPICEIHLTDFIEQEEMEIE